MMIFYFSDSKKTLKILAFGLFKYNKLLSNKCRLRTIFNFILLNKYTWSLKLSLF